MTQYKLSIISAFSVLLPLASAYWKRHSIWPKFSLLVTFLIVGGVNDLVSYILIKANGSNIINSNFYQLIEFILLIWLFKNWPSSRKNYFHHIVLLIGTSVWILDFCILHSISHYSSLFRVFGSILLIYVFIDQIIYTILNRENSIIFSKMLIKIGLVIYFLYKTFIESIQLFPTQFYLDWDTHFWFIECSLNILLNLLITIAFLCFRSIPNRSILT